jgi:hypothetical protein
MEENRSIWQYLEFPEICPAEHFSEIDPKELEDDVKLKSDQHANYGEFQAVRFRVKKTFKTKSWFIIYALITEGYKSSFGISKIGDVVDSNSCHTRSIRLSHSRSHH